MQLKSAGYPLSRKGLGSAAITNIPESQRVKTTRTPYLSITVEQRALTHVILTLRTRIMEELSFEILIQQQEKKISGEVSHQQLNAPVRK